MPLIFKQHGCFETLAALLAAPDIEMQLLVKSLILCLASEPVLASETRKPAVSFGQTKLLELGTTSIPPGPPEQPTSNKSLWIKLSPAVTPVTPTSTSDKYQETKLPPLNADVTPAPSGDSEEPTSDRSLQTELPPLKVAVMPNSSKQPTLVDQSAPHISAQAEMTPAQSILSTPDKSSTQSVEASTMLVMSDLSAKPTALLTREEVHKLWMMLTSDLSEPFSFHVLSYKLLFSMIACLMKDRRNMALMKQQRIVFVLTKLAKIIDEELKEELATLILSLKQDSPHQDEVVAEEVSGDSAACATIALQEVQCKYH